MTNITNTQLIPYPNPLDQPSYTLTMYIAFGSAINSIRQRHWTFIIQHPETHRCTFYHVTGGPSEYKHSIERNQTMSDPRLTDITRIGAVSATMHGKVTGILLNTRPQRCQMYILDVLSCLEREKTIERGWAEYFGSMSDVGISMLDKAREAMAEDLGVSQLPHGRLATGELEDIALFVDRLRVSELEYCRCFF